MAWTICVNVQFLLRGGECVCVCRKNGSNVPGRWTLSLLTPWREREKEEKTKKKRKRPTQKSWREGEKVHVKAAKEHKINATRPHSGRITSNDKGTHHFSADLVQLPVASLTEWPSAVALVVVPCHAVLLPGGGPSASEKRCLYVFMTWILEWQKGQQSPKIGFRLLSGNSSHELLGHKAESSRRRTLETNWNTILRQILLGHSATNTFHRNST